MGTPEKEIHVDTSSHSVCYIVAGGPSLRGFDWSRLNGKFVIAINRAYEILPDAQIVYFTDKDFWERHKKGLLNHKGNLFRGALNPHSEESHERVTLFHLTGREGLEKTPLCLRHGHNSTYAALNLAAVHLNFKTIVLLGADMKWGKLGDTTTSHWHSGHPRLDNERTFTRFLLAYQTIVLPLEQLGVKVYNASPDSALNTFEKISINQALALS